jgi:hypothetical protein
MCDPNCLGTPTTAPTTMPTPFSMVSELLEWLANRAAPLAALTIGISAFLWSDFRHEFGLPISFASGSVVTALPAIFAVVCGAAIVLFIAALLPAMVLVTPITLHGPRLADLMRRPVAPLDAPAGSVSAPNKAERWLFHYWWITAIFDVVIWAAVIGWSTINSKSPIWIGLIVVLGMILLQSWVGWRVVIHVSPESSKPSKGFVFFLCLAQILQAYVGFAVLLIVLSSAAGSELKDIVLAIVLMIVTMGILALIQLTVSNRVAQGGYPNALKHVVCLTLLALAAASIIQPLGARLASFALTSTANPSKQCTVFVLRDAQKDMSLKLLLTPGSTARTVPFNFVFPSDSQFYIRQKSSGTTFVLDAKAVMATLPCSDEAKANADPAKKDATPSSSPPVSPQDRKEPPVIVAPGGP